MDGPEKEVSDTATIAIDRPGYKISDSDTGQLLARRRIQVQFQLINTQH